MKIIESNIIPFKGYKAVTVWPFIFVRKGLTMKDVDVNHELIHGEQQKEMLLVLFFLWYAVEWLVRLVCYMDAREAYRNISLEQEAYVWEDEYGYLLYIRKPFGWVKFLRRKTYRRKDRYKNY